MDFLITNSVINELCKVHSIEYDILEVMYLSK